MTMAMLKVKFKKCMKRKTFDVVESEEEEELLALVGGGQVRHGFNELGQRNFAFSMLVQQREHSTNEEVLLKNLPN